jgi:flagellar assembly factor FliW
MSELEEIDELPRVELPEGLVGIPAAQRFELARWGGDESPYAMFRCLDVEDLEFVVVAPGPFFPDYAPVVDDEVVDALELRTAEDAVVLVIVTVADPVDRSTANLLGPIVVNRRTHRGAQVVLDPEEHDPRRPLLASAVEPARG